MRKTDLTRVSSVVLDTHVWVWASCGDKRAARLQDYGGRCVIPAISIWEVGMLCAKGRLMLKPDCQKWVKANLIAPAHLQPLLPSIALRSSELAQFHGDPADRMIVATALELHQPLVTADSKIIEWFESQPSLADQVVGL